MKYLVFLMLVLLALGCGKATSVETEPVPDAILSASLIYASDGEIKFNWTYQYPQQILGYKIYRTNGTTNTMTLLKTVGRDTTFFVDKALDYDKEYSYAITAYNKKNESAKFINEALSNISPLNVNRPATPILKIFYGQNFSNVGKKNIIFSWGGNFKSDIKGWEIFRTSSATTLNINSDYLTFSVDSMYVDTTIVAGAKYKYAIRSIDKGNKESNLSDVFEAVALAQPQIISPTYGSATSTLPVFKWTMVTNADKYQIVIYENPVNNPIFKKFLTTDTYIYTSSDVNLLKNKTYYWKIVTYSGISEEPNSDSKTFTFIVN